MSDAPPAGDAGRRVARSLLWEQRRTVAVTLVFSLAGAALEGLGLGLLIPLLHSITDPAAAPLASGVGWVDRWVLAVDAEPMARLYQVSGAILVSIVLRSALGYGSQVASLRTTERVLHRLREQAFDRLVGLQLSYFTSHRGGDLLNTLTTELHRLRFLFATFANVAIRSMVLLAYAALALWISWELTAVALACVAALSLWLRGVVRETRGRGMQIAAENGRITSRVSEFVGGARTVKAFGAEGYERRRFRAASEAATRTLIASGTLAARVRPLAEALASAVLVGLVVVSVRLLVAGGGMTVPELLAFLFAIFRLLPIAHELNNARGVLANLHGSWAHVVRFLDPSDKPALASGAVAPGPLAEGLRFEGVSFAYEPGRPVLRDVTLTVPRGATVALVGASGAGKSTLVDLVPRFADPTEGAVLWDGADLRTLDLAALRARIAVVSQDTFLFHDTIAANIAYGDDAPDPARVAEAARLADALDFVEGLPDGFETVLGDRGARLSGGQRQRIAIARALYRDPDVLILDEATSALDTASERRVQRSLDALRRGRTALVIAHRLSTVEDADLVVVMEDGRVEEVGTYDELVARRGRLYAFHRLQGAPVEA